MQQAFVKKTVKCKLKYSTKTHLSAESFVHQHRQKSDFCFSPGAALVDLGQTVHTVINFLTTLNSFLNLGKTIEIKCKLQEFFLTPTACLVQT